MKYILAMTILVLLTSCASIHINHSKTIQGTWRNSTFSDDGFYFEEVTFTKEGKKCTLVIGLDGTYGVEFGAYISSWKIIGDELHITVEQSSSEYVYVGETLIDKIYYLDDKLLQTKLKPTEPAFENAELSSYGKVDATPNLEICKTAENLLRSKFEQK